MSMNVTQWMNLTETKSLLKNLRHYQKLTRDLGSRWRELFHREYGKTSKYVVEYNKNISSENIWEYAQSVFNKSFGVHPEISEIVFVERSDISWGIKVYKDDMMVDLSYNGLKKKIQK